MKKHTYATLIALIAGSAFTPAFAASSAFQSEILSDSPFLYYRLGEDSGTTAGDTSVNSRPGTYTNSPTLGVAGAAVGGDTAVTFDGTNDYVLTTNALGFGQALDGSSFEFVFKTTTTDRGERLFGTYNEGSTTGIDIALNENAIGNAALANAVRIYLRDEDGNQYGATFTNATLFNGEYNHLVLTYDATNGLLGYVNGAAQTITLSTSNSATNPDNFSSDFDYAATLAARNVRGTISDFFDGSIDEFAIYNGVLTSQQVADHYAAVIPEPGTFALFGGALALGAVMLRRRN